MAANENTSSFKQRAGRFGRRASLGILLLVVLGSTGYYFWRTYTVSDGTRSGLLFKISRKGVVFKTFEGQLHLGGSAIMSDQSVWNFSVKNRETYEQLQQLEGQNVRLYYKEVVDAFPWQGDTDYLIYKAEPAPVPQSQQPNSGF